MVKVIISKCWCQLQALYHCINSTLIFAVIYGRRMLKGRNLISNFRCRRLLIRRCLPRGELTVKIKRRQNRSQEMQIQNRSHLWTSIQMQSVQSKRCDDAGHFSMASHFLNISLTCSANKKLLLSVKSTFYNDAARLSYNWVLILEFCNELVFSPAFDVYGRQKRLQRLRGPFAPLVTWSS